MAPKYANPEQTSRRLSVDFAETAISTCERIAARFDFSDDISAQVSGLPGRALTLPSNLHNYPPSRGQLRSTILCIKMGFVRGKQEMRSNAPLLRYWRQNPSERDEKQSKREVRRSKKKKDNENVRNKAKCREPGSKNRAGERS
jgi:hypothetical protein